MPTALELGPEGWKAYVKAARSRSSLRGMTDSDRSERQEILHRVRKLAAVLKTRFGARRVILFGSLAHDAWFMPDSDIDLAVEGLQGKAYWEAWRLAEEMIADRPVDLIEIETVTESMKQAMDRHGVVL